MEEGRGWGVWAQPAEGGRRQALSVLPLAPLLVQVVEEVWLCCLLWMRWCLLVL